MKFPADKQKLNKTTEAKNKSHHVNKKHKFRTCAHKISASPIAKIMEDSIPVIL